MAPEWSDELYGTGYEEIDKDHQEILNAINSLLSGFKDGDLDTTMENTLLFLETYTIEHFRKEEALMKSTNCKGYSQNKKEHMDFERKLLDFRLRFTKEGYNRTNLKEFLTFISSWIVDHVQRTDILLRTTLSNA